MREGVAEKRILVIDDDHVILDSIARQLKDQPFVVDYESDASTILPRIGSNGYDLVLCDIKMKPVNGLDVLKSIKSEHPRLPVVMLSAFVDDQTVESARNLGCDEFLFKPVRKKMLIDTILKVSHSE